MKGEDMYFDKKLELKPLVILNKIEEVKENSPKKCNVLLNKKKQSAGNNRKIKFLANLGLFPSGSLKKQLANEVATKLSLKATNIPRNGYKFCCAGFGRMPKCQWFSHAVCYWESSLYNPFDGKQLTLRHLKLSPRICVKKWLGGERIVNSQKKFKILENSLIPKTRNHYYCREKAKKHFSTVNGDADCPTAKHSFTENDSDQNERPSLVLPKMSLENSDNKSNMQKLTNRLLRSRDYLELSDGLSSSKWSVHEIKEGKQSNVHFGEGHKTNIDLKEVRICLKRWEGEGTIVVPKEKSVMQMMFQTCPRE